MPEPNEGRATAAIKPIRNSQCGKVALSNLSLADMCEYTICQAIYSERQLQNTKHQAIYSERQLQNSENRAIYSKLQHPNTEHRVIYSELQHPNTNHRAIYSELQRNGSIWYARENTLPQSHRI